MRSFLVISFFVLACAGSVTAQQVNVSASVSQTTLTTNDRLQFTIDIQAASLSNVSVPDPPDVEGLELLYTVPSSRRRINIINGQSRHSVSYQWTYRPVQAGTARIGSAVVRIGSDDYRTDPIRVTVLQGGSAAPLQPPATTAAPAERDIFIRVTPSTRDLYQGQQTSIDYRLFWREGVRIHNSRLQDPWDAEGFWREELAVERNPMAELETIDGLRYYSMLLKRVAAFPTRSGQLRIDPLRIETDVLRRFRSDDPFEQLFSSFAGRYEATDVVSPPLTFNVKPHPPGAPDHFAGAVGRFDMQAVLDRRTANAGDAVRLTVTISGSGNLATLPPPQFELPQHLERYAPDSQTDIRRDGRQVEGTKSFTYVLVPRAGGDFELPPIRFAYLDPQTGTYRQISREPGVIRVTGPPPPPDEAAPIASGPSLSADEDNAAPTRLVRYALIVLLPLLALLTGVVLYRRRQRTPATETPEDRSRRAHPLARRHLKQAEVLLRSGDPRGFYEEIARAVLGFIGNRLNISEHGQTHRQLDARFTSLGVPEETRDALRVILEESDRARFAPVLPDRAAMETAIERAARLITDLDDTLTEHGEFEESL